MGRGLAAILPRSRADEAGLRELALDLIKPNPRQPRRDFDEEALLALSESIGSRGLLQPILVRPLAGGEFELVAGERRLRAAKLAGLESIPAVIRQAEDWERLDLALAENMARVDLNPIEEARACAMLVDDLGLTKGEVGRRIGKSRVAVSNLIRLLELPDEVLEMVESGILSEGHGRAILQCKSHAERRRLAADARADGWSVRETERRAKRAEHGSRRDADRRPEAMHPDLAEALAAVEDTLATALGRPVKVRPRGAGCRVELDFDSPPEAVKLAEELLRRGAGRQIRAA
ncbi:MAG: ParB/RepB/Spo0J family partition protein [Thermoleophilaceae bacterium]|nr:ParB/RepB/Spo0J family partition protein [Thermoleophilaceae bacterium]